MFIVIALRRLEKSSCNEGHSSEIVYPKDAYPRLTRLALGSHRCDPDSLRFVNVRLPIKVDEG